MTLLQKQSELIERYSLIEDRHERLNAIISFKLADRQLAAEERRDEWLVRGCSSQVWLRVQVAENRMEVRYAADSVMIRGLVALLVELYHGADIADARDFHPTLLEALGLDKILSPTRLHGLERVIQTFRAHVD
ncbi:MAG: SufE family protein [Chthoniobacterales bacterium]